MTPDTFETRSLRSRNQFEAWREWHQPVLDSLPQHSARYGFPADVHLWKRRATSGAILSIIGLSATACGARISRTRLGPRSRYLRKCPFSLRSDKNSCMSGRIYTGSRSSWRATGSEILRRCSMPPAGRLWTRLSGICRLVGMSRSNLYRLFEDTGGVARYIQRERQLEAHAVLTDPASTQSISSIAEDLCLADASSFSRAFKREFGHSPGELRLAALAGLAPPARTRRLAPSAGTDFGELIRGF